MLFLKNPLLIVLTREKIVENHLWCVIRNIGSEDMNENKNDNRHKCVDKC